MLQRSPYIVLLVMVCLFSKAQQPAFRQINKASGLPTNTIYDIKQSANGLLWLGTGKGLCRYDGVTAYLYSSNKQNGKGVTSIKDVGNGVVYCQNFTGQLFYTQGDSLIEEQAVKPAKNYYPMQMLKGNILFFDNNTIYVINPKTHKATTVAIPNAIFEYTCVKDDKLYLFNYNGNLLEFDGRQIKIIGSYTKIGANTCLMHPLPGGILIAEKHENKNFEIIDEKGGNKQIAGINAMVLLQNTISTGTTTWICTSGGAYLFDASRRAVDAEPLFPKYSISSVLQDREGAYWFATLDNGLLYVPNIAMAISNSPADYHITALAQGPTNNTVLAGTSANSLLLYNTQTNQYSLKDSLGLINEVTACAYDPTTQAYLYSSSNLLIIKQGKKTKLENLAVKGLGVLSGGIYALAYSGGGGLITINGKNPKLFFPYVEKSPLKENDIYAFPVRARSRAVEVVPNDTTVYLAYVTGLYLFTTKGYKQLLLAGKPIVATSVKWFNGKLYIATFTQGILCYNAKTEQISQVYTRAADNQGYIKVDGSGSNIFFASEGSFYVYNTATSQAAIWNTDDGLPEADITGFLVKNDTVYLSTENGLAIFNINSPSKNTVPPPIFIAGTQSNGRQSKGLLCLPYKDNSLSVSFTVPAFKGGKHIRVLYRLNDDEWVEAPVGNRIIQFKSLAAGSYSLQIKAINEDGIESLQPVRFDFEVAQAFYQTWWFFAIVILLLALIARLVYAYRVSKLIKKQKAELERQELKRKLDNSTLKTLRAQMNPHFIHNALNSIQSYVFSGEKELASKYLGLFSELSRSLLDSSTQTEVSLHDEIKLIDRYLQLECIRLPKIKYVIITAPNVQEHMIHLPAMILQPLVENAVNHGFANKTENCYLEIRFAAENGYLKVEVDDNGIGRDKAAEINKRKNRKHQSFSTQAIEDRIALLNKNRKEQIKQTITDKYDTNHNPMGTLVELLIPIEND